MLTFAAHLVAHFIGAVLIPRVGRALCRLAKRLPVVAALAALWGVVLGAWLVAVSWPHDLPTAALGLFVLVGYIVAMGMFARKVWDGSWGEWCDVVATHF